MGVHDFTSHYEPFAERVRCGPHEILRGEDGRVHLRAVHRIYQLDEDPEPTTIVGPGSLEAHEVEWEPGQPPTVTPSILCANDESGVGGIHIHGYITAGEWVPCGDDRSVPLVDA